MRIETLPSPGQLASGLGLRREAAKAISAVEINAGIPANAGVSRSAGPLHEFFTACATAVASLRDLVLPTIAARSATNANTSLIILTGSEGFDPDHVPDPANFAVTVQARTVTKVAIDGPFVFLTLNAPLAAGAVSVAYTQSGTADKRLRDTSNNLLASFTAAAVTNSIT